MIKHRLKLKISDELNYHIKYEKDKSMIITRINVEIIKQLKDIIKKTNSDDVIIINIFSKHSNDITLESESFINKNDDALLEFLENFEYFNYKPDYLDIITYNLNIESMS